MISIVPPQTLQRMVPATNQADKILTTDHKQSIQRCKVLWILCINITRYTFYVNENISMQYCMFLLYKSSPYETFTSECSIFTGIMNLTVTYNSILCFLVSGVPTCGFCDSLDQALDRGLLVGTLGLTVVCCRGPAPRDN